jgi:hypothetical protein
MRHGGWADGAPAGGRAIGNHGTTASPPPPRPLLQGRRMVTDWYAGGVAATCEWLAAAVFRPESGTRRVSPSTGKPSGISCGFRAD